MGSETVYWDDYSGRVATIVHETEKPTHSTLLGPDGNPMSYEKKKIGFDLTPKGNGRNDNTR